MYQLVINEMRHFAGFPQPDFNFGFKILAH